MSDSILPGVFSHSPGVVPATYVAFRQLNGMHNANDVEDGGNFYVSGTAGIDSYPDVMGKYRVRLFDKKSGRLARETWSDTVTGEYRFENLREGPWFVIAYDHTGAFNAVVADSIFGVLQ